VQCIVLISNILLSSLFPTCCRREIQGCAVHSFRWAEWIPSWRSDDVPDGQHRRPWKPKNCTQVCQDLSSAWLLARCFLLSQLTSWLTYSLVAWLLFCALYVKCYTQAKRVLCFEDILQARSATNWLAPVADRRLYRNLDHVGRRLFLTCLAPTCSTRQHICESCSSVVTTSIFEVASKIWYPRPHWAYDRFFDESTRAVRQLEELLKLTFCRLSSFDVIALRPKRRTYQC
jgi:hypothetical protein